MRLIYMIAADVLRTLGWEVEIKEKDSYWNLVLTNTTSSMDMPESHKSCLRGLLRGWLMEFNFEGGRQQVNIYKELHGLDPEDDRYSCLDTCVNRMDNNTPVFKLADSEIFVRRKDRFDRYVLAEPVADPQAKNTPQTSKKNKGDMERRTQFIDTTDGAWIKGVPCLIPNLQEGQFVITMDGKEKDYRKWRWRIDKIETTIGSDVDTVLQEVYMTCCGPEDQWQETIGKKK